MAQITIIFAYMLLAGEGFLCPAWRLVVAQYVNVRGYLDRDFECEPPVFELMSLPEIRSQKCEPMSMVMAQIDSLRHRGILR